MSDKIIKAAALIILESEGYQLELAIAMMRCILHDMGLKQAEKIKKESYKAP